MDKLNKIFLRRSNKLFLEKNNIINFENIQYISTILHNIEKLGYKLDNEIIKCLLSWNFNELIKFNYILTEELKILVGSNYEYNPMYPNFPNQVMEMNEAELYFNAYIHYYDFNYLPDYDKLERPNDNEDVNYKLIRYGNSENLINELTELLYINNSLSEQDKQDIKCLIDYNNIDLNKIKYKETQAFILKDIDLNIALNIIKTPTDLLRLIVAKSDGDITLTTPTKFKSMKRKDRYSILSKINILKIDLDQLWKYRNQWLRIGEKLHPGEFKKLTNTLKYFDVLRNGKHETFLSKVEFYLKNKSINVIDLLKNNPGEFARRLNSLLCILPEHNSMYILSCFDSVIEFVSTPVLFQLLSYFKNRNSYNEFRLVFLKGNLCNIKIIESQLKPIDNLIIKEIISIIESELIRRFRKLPSLGSVYIDSELKNYIIPFNQRSASNSLLKYIRGSKIKFNKNKTLRLYVHWKDCNIDTRTDVDLTIGLFDDAWENVGHISYTNLKIDDLILIIVGILPAPNGASEFIDLNINKLNNNKIRYITMNIYSFTGETFDEIPECFCGWMEREYPNSNQIFEPKTLKQRIELNSKSTSTIPMIIDTQTGEIIWADIQLKPSFNNYIEANTSKLSLIGKTLTNLNKPNLYDLFRLHILARANLVIPLNENPDVIYSVDKGITPQNIDLILSEYLI